MANNYSKKKTDRKADDEKAVVQNLVDQFEASWKYCQTNYHTRWEESWKLYNNKRVKRGYQGGVADVFVPMTFSTIETMVAALAGGKPSFDFIPPEDKLDQDTEVLNARLDMWWDKDQWDIKIQNFIRSMLVYGTSVVYLQWNVDHPVMTNIPIRDFFFNPNAVNIEGMADGFYCGRRYLTTIEELEAFEVVDSDPKSKTYGQMVKKYKNLDKVKASSTDTADKTDKEQKDLYYGSTAPDPEKTQVEVIEFWKNDKVCSVANRSVLIEDDENPHLTQAKAMGEENPKGIIPFAIQRDYVDESLFLGRGEVEFIADQQEQLNDLTNQNMDAISYTLNPMWNLNPDKQDIMEQIQAAPGAVFPLLPGELSPVQLPQIPREAFNERINIKNEIREATAVDQVVKGVTTTGSATATEIESQIASAGQRLGMKITQLENEGFHRIARIVLRMDQLYTNKPAVVRTKGRNGVEFLIYDPTEYSGEYEPRVQLSSSVERSRAEKKVEAKELLAAFLNDPDVDQRKLKQKAFEVGFDMDPDEARDMLSQDNVPTAPPLPGELNPDEELFPLDPVPAGTGLPQ